MSTLNTAGNLRQSPSEAKKVGRGKGPCTSECLKRHEKVLGLDYTSTLNVVYIRGILCSERGKLA
jgi:hypothetical protein